jgi:glycosyltransferase involved in cell wall biosynthesis
MVEQPSSLEPGISVVIPVYNSEASLASLAGKLADVLPRVAGGFEVILVNDGSRDKSGKIAGQLAGRYDWIRVIDLMRNYGQHCALLCGIRAARFATVVTMDDDLQNPPEEIPKLLERLDQGFDVVYGTPRKEGHNLWRRLASWATKVALQSAMGAETARQTSAFRAFRTDLRDAFAAYRSPFVSVDVLLTWGTTRFDAVQVRHDPRRLGSSTYTFRKLMAHALTMMTGFSAVPLQLASVMGFALTGFGLVVLAYVLGRYLIQGGSVPGFPFLASLIAIFSGAQMFALGIIGEYLIRIHFRLMDRPSYVVLRGGAPRKDRGPAATPQAGIVSTGPEPGNGPAHG